MNNIIFNNRIGIIALPNEICIHIDMKKVLLG